MARKKLCSGSVAFLIMYCSYVGQDSWCNFTLPHLFLLLLPIALLQTNFSASSLWKTALHFFQAFLLFVAATLVYAWITTAPQPQNSSSCLELACVCTDVELRFATGLKCYTSNPQNQKEEKLPYVSDWVYHIIERKWCETFCLGWRFVSIICSTSFVTLHIILWIFCWWTFLW